jgi:hypothetical protein
VDPTLDPNALERVLTLDDAEDGSPDKSALDTARQLSVRDPGRSGNWPMAPAPPPACPPTPEERDPRTAERLPEGKRKGGATKSRA